MLGLHCVYAVPYDSATYYTYAVFAQVTFNHAWQLLQIIMSSPICELPLTVWVETKEI